MEILIGLTLLIGFSSATFQIYPRNIDLGVYIARPIHSVDTSYLYGQNDFSALSSSDVVRQNAISTPQYNVGFQGLSYRLPQYNFASGLTQTGVSGFSRNQQRLFLRPYRSVSTRLIVYPPEIISSQIYYPTGSSQRIVSAALYFPSGNVWEPGRNYIDLFRYSYPPYLRYLFHGPYSRYTGTSFNPAYFGGQDTVYGNNRPFSNGFGFNSASYANGFPTTGNFGTVPSALTQGSLGFIPNGNNGVYRKKNVY